MVVTEIGSAQDLAHSCFYSIKAVADAEVRRIAGLVEDYVFIGTPAMCPKRYNLTHDQSQWEAWCTHIRTGKRSTKTDAKRSRAAALQRRDIVIIAARRKYIPPLMSSYQDIVITLISKSWTKANGDAQKIRLKGEKTKEVCRGMFDSLRTTSLQNFKYDFNVLQCKVSLLLWPTPHTSRSN